MSFLSACKPDAPASSDIEAVILDDFETLVAYEDNILAVPTVLRHDGDGTLFVYDAGETKALALDRDGRPATRCRIVLCYFLSGTSMPDGNLFLALPGEPLKIHRLRPHGELTRMHEVQADETELAPIFDSDAAEGQTLRVSDAREHRAYAL